jgi:hypothetical protein
MGAAEAACLRQKTGQHHGSADESRPDRRERTLKRLNATVIAGERTTSGGSRTSAFEFFQGTSGL